MLLKTLLFTGPSHREECHSAKGEKRGRVVTLASGDTQVPSSFPTLPPPANSPSLRPFHCPLLARALVPGPQESGGFPQLPESHGLRVVPSAPPRCSVAEQGLQTWGARLLAVVLAAWAWCRW